MSIRLFVISVAIASIGQQVAAQGTGSDLYAYFWKYVEYLSYTEANTESSSLALYSASANPAMDQVHGDSPTTGDISRLASLVRNFQEYLNIPTRGEFPDFDTSGATYEPKMLFKEKICKPFDCSKAPDDPINLRRLDGKCNNLAKPLWGSAIVSQERFVRGLWEKVANSSTHTPVDGLFTDTRFLGKVSDFREPEIFKVKGSGPFHLVGFDAEGSTLSTSFKKCENGCTVKNGAISAVTRTKKNGDCIPRFQQFSNKFIAEGRKCNGAEFEVNFFRYSFLLTLQPHGSRADSTLTVFDSSGDESKTVSSSKNKFGQDLPTPYWLSLGSNEVSISSGTEFSEDAVFLTAGLASKLNTASVVVSGDGSSVQFVSTDVYQTVTDSFNSPVSLDNIAFTYAYYKFRFGIEDVTRGFEVNLIGRPAQPATVCVSDCTNVEDGDYQSCVGCNVYVTCSNDIIIKDRPCPASLVWDQNARRCERTSATCGTKSAAGGPSVKIVQDGNTLSIKDSHKQETVERNIDTRSIPSFTTAAGKTLNEFSAVWVAWYGDKFFVGYGNTIGKRTIAFHDYAKENFWFKIDSLEIGSVNQIGWAFDIEQQGTPRRSSGSTANPLPSMLDVAQLIHKRTTEEVKWSSSLTMAVFSYGQWFDHDVVATPLISYEGHAPMCCVNGEPVELGAYSNDACFNIEVNTNHLTSDELAPFNKGIKCLDFVRSATTLDCSTDPESVDDRQRQQMNVITSYIDGSNVYGSDEETFENLRDGDTCFLLLADNELPFETVPGEACVPNAHCRFAGDFRSQENPILASIHTLFVREHNRIATILTDEGGYSNDTECFYAVRNIVIGEIQVITENGYFPSYLNEGVLKDNNFKKDDTVCRYDPKVNGGIRNEFGIAYRMGHTWISNTLRGGVNGGQIKGDLTLRNNFFNPKPFLSNGIRSNGFLNAFGNACPGTDKVLEDDVMFHLFENIGTASNLAALNNQRGLGHGVPTLTGIRAFFKLSVPKTLDDLFTFVDSDTVDNLKRLYDSVKDVDLFTAAVIERPMDGSSVGPIINHVLGRQLRQMKEGDRFWHTCYFSKEAEIELQKVTLGRVLCDNVKGQQGLQEDIFKQVSKDNKVLPCPKRPEMNFDVFSKANAGGRVEGFGDQFNFQRSMNNEREPELRNMLEELLKRLETADLK